MARRASRTSTNTGFTIVELLIVVVVIAILAAITIVSYNGITNRAKASAVQSTTKQAYNKILSFTVDNAETYPANLAAIGITDSGDTTYQYYVNNGVNPRKFCVASLKGSTSYYMSSTQGSPIQGTCYGQNLANTSISGWETGQYSQTSGTPASDSSRLRQIDFIAVDAGASYNFKTNSTDYNYAVRAYTADKTFISSLGGITSGTTLTMPANAAYVSISLYGPSTATFSSYTIAFSNGTIIPNVIQTTSP